MMFTLIPLACPGAARFNVTPKRTVMEVPPMVVTVDQAITEKWIIPIFYLRPVPWWKKFLNWIKCRAK